MDVEHRKPILWMCCEIYDTIRYDTLKRAYQIVSGNLRSRMVTQCFSADNLNISGCSKTIHQYMIGNNKHRPILPPPSPVITCCPVPSAGARPT